MPTMIRVLVLMSLLTVAQTKGESTASAEPNWWGLGVGLAEVLDSWEPPLASVEWRAAWNFHGLHPQVLFALATDGAVYGGVALLYHWELAPRWRLSLSSGPGYYDRQRSPKDLGSSLEFFSAVEISREIAPGRRLGLSLGHVSNGSIGDRNPGSEVLRVIYSIASR